MVYVFMALMLGINMMRVVDIMGKGMFNLALSDVLLLPVLLYMLFQVRKEPFKEVFKHYGIMLMLTVWILFTGVQAMRAPEIMSGGPVGLISELLKTVICIGYFFVGHYFLKVCSRKQFTLTWVLALCVSVIWGVVSFYFIQKGLPFFGIEPRFHYLFLGTDTDPNHAATFYFVSFFAFGALLIDRKVGLEKGALYGAMLLALVGVVLTGSRGGLISLVVGMGIVFMGYAMTHRKKALLLLLLVLLALNVTITIDRVAMDDYIMSRTLSKFSSFEAGMEIRTSLGKTAFYMGNDHALFGVGRGNYSLNSEPYFEALSFKYIDDIPHNTYTGLYAEVGLVGLLLFVSPVLLLVIAAIACIRREPTLLKRHLESITWTLAGLGALAVQASVLNVENRRFFWFLAGVLLYILNTYPKEPEAQVQEATDSFHSKGLLAGLLVGVLVFTAYTAVQASVTLPLTTYTDDVNFNIPYVVTSPGEPHAVVYRLVLPMNEDKSPRIRVAVIERSPSGEALVLSEKDIIGASGYIQQTFEPQYKGSELMVAVTRLDDALKSYRFLAEDLYLDSQILVLNRWFYLQPYTFSKHMAKHRLEDQEQVEVGFENAIGATFDERLQLESVVFIEEDSKLVLTYKVLGDFEEGEAFSTYLYGYPTLLNAIDEGFWARGFDAYSLAEPIDTGTWRAGERRDVVFSIHSCAGVYNMRTGFFRRMEEKTLRLTLLDGKNVLTLGNLKRTNEE